MKEKAQGLVEYLLILVALLVITYAFIEVLYQEVFRHFSTTLNKYGRGLWVCCQQTREEDDTSSFD